MKWAYTDCTRGDIIRVKLGSVYHYGIFVSMDEVIAFGLPPTPENLSDQDSITVISTDIDVFSCGRQVEVAQMSLRERMSRRSPDKTVTLARSRLGEGGYNLLHNNCEHFVNEVVFDRSESSQEQAVRQKWQEFLSKKGSDKP